MDSTTVRSAESRWVGTKIMSLYQRPKVKSFGNVQNWIRNCRIEQQQQSPQTPGPSRLVEGRRIMGRLEAAVVESQKLPDRGMVGVAYGAGCLVISKNHLRLVGWRPKVKGKGGKKMRREGEE